MITVLAISVIIIAIVIVLAVVTTSKAYTYKHTVDSADPISKHKEELEEGSDKQIT